MADYYLCPMHGQEKCFCIRKGGDLDNQGQSFRFPPHDRNIRHYFAGDTGDPCLGGRRYDGRMASFRIDRRRIESMLTELSKEERRGDKSASFVEKRREELEKILIEMSGG